MCRMREQQISCDGRMRQVTLDQYNVSARPALNGGDPVALAELAKQARYRCAAA